MAATKQAKIPIPTRIRKVEVSTPLGLLHYFVACCNDIWERGDKLAPEYASIMPQRMTAFMRQNAIGFPKYRDFVDYLLNVHMSKTEPPNINFLLSRSFYIQFTHLEASQRADSPNSGDLRIPGPPTSIIE